MCLAQVESGHGVEGAALEKLLAQAAHLARHVAAQQVCQLAPVEIGSAAADEALGRRVGIEDLLRFDMEQKERVRRLLEQHQCQFSRIVRVRAHHCESVQECGLGKENAAVEN